MKIAVIGSRKFKNLGLVARKVDHIVHHGGNPNELTIISGGASGVDTYAVGVASTLNIDIKVIRPNYELYGDDAPHKRNDEIIAEADKVIAFWTGERVHSGTWSVISKCLQRGKDIEVIFDQH